MADFYAIKKPCESGVFYWIRKMILYKYVSFEAAKKILETNTLGFSHLDDFNDPFESTAFGFQDHGIVTNRVQTNAYRNRFSDKYAVLSLTDNPLNPLMWAHYGVSHTGVVLGIDVDKAGLNHESFVIPVSKGKIEYFIDEPCIGEFSLDAELLRSVGSDELINLNNANAKLLKHAFLYKQNIWDYENEIRVVKNLINISKVYKSRYVKTHTQPMVEEGSKQIWSRLYIDRSIYCLHIPTDAFVSVYLGNKSYRDQNNKYSKQLHTMQSSSDPILSKQKPTHGYKDFIEFCQNRTMDIYSTTIDIKNWCLHKKPHPKIGQLET